MEKQLDIGDTVIYVDPQRVAHNALVTTVWPQMAGGGGEPGCNLLYVHEDPARDDPYGRQIERATSVVHKSWQPAGGNFWCRPDEWDGPVHRG